MSRGVRTTLVAAGVVGLLAAVAVVGLLYVGESVRLTTTMKTGEQAHTWLWVVDDGEALYLRAADPESRWVARLQREPRVRLERAGESRPYRAEPRDDDAIRKWVNELMAEKYGVWDRLESVLFDRDTVLPIRLEPER